MSEKAAVLGRRCADVPLGDLPPDVQPGDLWRYVHPDGTPLLAAALYPFQDTSGNLTGGVWGYASPDGNGIGTLALHTVREHDDGTVSIRPGDGSSNSVLHDDSWHGYVEHNVWSPC